MVGEEEVEGLESGEEIHFSRVISAGGSSSYRLNDKEVRYSICRTTLKLKLSLKIDAMALRMPYGNCK